jgi:hypothetical protein
MEHLLFNLDGDIHQVAARVFGALECGTPAKGESFNVLNGVYYSCPVFGLNVKLESNAYDYEDEYSYVLSLKKNVLGNVKTDDRISELCAQVIGRLIVINLSILVARETADGLEPIG